jgi:hypothetical protein
MCKTWLCTCGWTTPQFHRVTSNHPCIYIRKRWSFFSSPSRGIAGAESWRNKFMYQGVPLWGFSAGIPVHPRTIAIDQPTSDHYPEEPTSTYVNSYCHWASAITLLCIRICWSRDKVYGWSIWVHMHCLFSETNRILDAIAIKDPDTKWMGLLVCLQQHHLFLN